MYLHDVEGFGEQGQQGGSPAPAAVLDRFDFDRSALKPFHSAEIERIARLIASRQSGSNPIRTITVTGHADHVGTDPYNRGLGLRRAQSVRTRLVQRLDALSTGLSRRVQIQVETRGEDRPIPGDAARSRRVEVRIPAAAARPGPAPPVPAPPTTQDVKVVVKSFIAPIGGRRGGTRCSLVDPVATLRLAALAAATDAAMSENPLTDRRDKRCRLFSARTFRVIQAGPLIVGVTATPLDTDTGLECVPNSSLCLTPPPMSLISASLARTGPGTFSFAWSAKGRPPRAAEPGFLAVCPRLSWFIWHNISGTIDCTSGRLNVTASLSGSRFPSHRKFINGVLVPPTVAQGPFSNLWLSDPGDVTKVA